MAGRPPKEKSFANMLNIAVKEANEQGTTKLREVANALVEQAIAGNVPAIKEIADRLDGKAMQEVEHSGELDVTGDVDTRQLSRAILAIIGQAEIEEDKP